MLVSLLLVNGNRIVDAGCDARGRKMRLERFSVLHAHHIEMVDPAGPGRFARRDDAAIGFRKKLVITMCQGAPRLITGAAAEQLYGERPSTDGLAAAIVR